MESESDCDTGDKRPAPSLHRARHAMRDMRYVTPKSLTHPLPSVWSKMSRESGVVGVPKVNKSQGDHIRLTDMLTKMLIREIHSRPCLWNELHNDHKKWAVSRTLWDEVGATVGLSGEDAKRKWKNLKDTYRRLLQKAPLKYGSDDDSVKKWKFSKLMTFIRDQMMPTSTVGNPSSSTGPVDEKENIANDTEMRDVDQSSITPECVVSTPQEVLDSDATVDKGIYRLRRLKAALINKRNLKKKVNLKKTKSSSSTVKTNTYKCEEDDDYHFLMSLLPYIRPLEPLAKLELRTRIQHDVMDAYRNYEHKRSGNDSKPGISCTESSHSETSTGSSTS